ncbi:MAG: DegV family protein [Candidatus Heimdallarchaeota archaeon]|nr:DegV family protein [Candidatus Heimdallarchaeota archaeon]
MAKQTVRILADATIDLPPSWVKKLNVGILPTQIMIEDREKPYRNYIDITAEEFFEKLFKVKEIPTTAVPKQGDIFKVYEESLKDYESLIVVAHSSKISGSYNIALKVSEMFPGKDITVIDSQTITIMEGMLVLEAAKLAQTGATKKEVLTRLHELIPHTHGVAVVKSLDYLRKGGRISFTKQVIANVANYRPIISIEGGLVKNIGKVKGFDNGIEIIKKKIPDILENLKISSIIIIHSVMPDEANELKEYILAQKENVPEVVECALIGPVLGAHLGPNCLGVGWIGAWDSSWFK